MRLGAATTAACRAQTDTVHLQVRPYDRQLYLHCFTELGEDGKCPAKSRVLFGFHWPARQLEEATSRTKVIRPIRKRRCGGMAGRRQRWRRSQHAACRSAFLILKVDLSGTHQSPASAIAGSCSGCRGWARSRSRCWRGGWRRPWSEPPRSCSSTRTLPAICAGWPSRLLSAVCDTQLFSQTGRNETTVACFRPV